jgi:hypothetical protein
MVCGVFTKDNVPNNRIAGVVKRFQDNQPPPDKVEKTKNADGTWKVTVTFPPCPPDTTHSPS